MRNGEKPTSELKSIGESRRKALSKIGIETLDDLVKHYPRAYQNRGNTLTLSEIKENSAEGRTGPFSAVLTVAAEPKSILIRRGMNIIKLRVFDFTGTCEITFFNQNFLKEVFYTGSTFRFWGKFQFERGRLQSSSPIYEPYVEGRALHPIVPVYPTTKGLSQKIISQAVMEAVRQTQSEYKEFLPEYILSEAGLATLQYSIKNIHYPESFEALEASKRRLVFDEIFLTALALAVSGRKRRLVSSSSISDINLDEFIKNLKFTLTNAQRKAVDEIINDMSGQYAMNRILTGDVGSGKTIVAAAAAFISLKNGYSCLFMVPTEILARQHYDDLNSYFEKLNFSTYLLTGSTVKSRKNEIIDALSIPDKPVLVIGTHALLSDDISPVSLGLVIIDEQHRFGAMQRATLAKKTEGVHCLVMSATPIPRTLSLVIFGSLDISCIDELPAGREPVDTFIVDDRMRPRLNNFIRKQTYAGHQVYVVCPAIEDAGEPKGKREDSEEMSNLVLYDTYSYEEGAPLKTALEYSENLSKEMPDISIGHVHGKMRTAEREEVMSRFCSGEIQVLVSTTVIEVGVNVPNATLMIVENAERFGLSQLHQLRGRVGRGEFKSYFILVTDSKSDTARERLETLKRSKNGYEIAEADLLLRGPGDMFTDNGIMRQHGESSLALAAKCTDPNLITLASGMAEKVFLSDPELQEESHKGIRMQAEDLIRRSLNTVN